MATREPDLWAGVDAHYGADIVPDKCAACGEETYAPEEMMNGDVLCPECVRAYLEREASDRADAMERRAEDIRDRRMMGDD
jgi:uncharacterized Zn finger protein (UPF0148 family)